MSVLERLAKIQKNIDHHAVGPVTLVAVSKYATCAQIIEAFEAGIRDFGENKMQDALSRQETLPAEINRHVRWHFIGHLQGNKARKTVGRFALVHSVDTLALAQKLSALNEEAGIKQSVLLQVNLTGQPDRFGFSIEESPQAASTISNLPGLSLRGLMGMAPQSDHVTVLQNTFGTLRDLRDGLATQSGLSLPELSMGMSNDYVHALQCGATIIRIGSSLFG